MISVLFLVIIVFLLIILSLVWPPDSPWAPQWRINRSASRVALRFAKVGKKDTVYELGCGDGEFILTAAEEYDTRAVGIEIDPIRYGVSWIRARLSNKRNKINIIRKDFKKIDLSDATVVYMYLVPAAMKRLLPQLKKQLKSGTKVISYRYEIPLSPQERKIKLMKEEKKEKIYLYTVLSNTGRS